MPARGQTLLTLRFRRHRLNAAIEFLRWIVGWLDGRGVAMDNFWPVLFGWAFGLLALGVGLRLWDRAHEGS